MAEIRAGVTLISSGVDLITGRVIGMPTDDPFPSPDIDTPSVAYFARFSGAPYRPLPPPRCIFIDNRLLYIYVVSGEIRVARNNRSSMIHTTLDTRHPIYIQSG